MINGESIGRHNFGAALVVAHTNLLQKCIEIHGLRDEEWVMSQGLNDTLLKGGRVDGIAGSESAGLVNIGTPGDIYNRLRERGMTGREIGQAPIRLIGLVLSLGGEEYLRDYDATQPPCERGAQYFTVTTPDIPPIMTHQGYLMDLTGDDAPPTLEEILQVPETFGPDSVHSLTDDECEAIVLGLMDPALMVEPRYAADVLANSPPK